MRNRNSEAPGGGGPSPGPRIASALEGSLAPLLLLYFLGNSAALFPSNEVGSPGGRLEALTSGHAGRGGGAPCLLSQRHHVDNVLLPRLQSCLVKGGNRAGELSNHASFIVLESGEKRRKQKRRVTEREKDKT